MGHAVALYKIVVETHRGNNMPSGEMPLADPVPTDVMEPAPSTEQGSFGVPDDVLATQEYIDQMPTVYDASITHGLSRGNSKITTYVYGKLVYSSMGLTEKIEFCAMLARMRPIDKERIGNSLPDTGDPNFMMYACPKWNKVTQEQNPY
jgi:hypothetical protein